MTEKQLTGKVPRERILMLEVPRIDKAIIDAYLALSDLTGTVSDAMDELGIVGVVPSLTLSPTIPRSRIVGPALTLRNIMQRDQAYKHAKEKSSKLAEIEGHNLAQPGDVMVCEGIEGISNMGGISATIGKRQGEVAAIVDGAIRDVEESRSIGFPIWSKGVSPITGKWRIETAMINGTIEVCGVQVNPGDLVAADESGVCFVPRAAISEVLKRAQAIAEAEARRHKDIQSGMSVVELSQRTFVYKY